MSKRFPEKLPW